MAGPHHARVLLLDDDPTIRLFVSLALADLGVEVVACDTVDGALDELSGAPFALLLIDLVLREGSGWDLLHALRRTPTLIGQARVAVFSAAIDAAARQRLASLGIWRCLPKPASLDQLQACTREALACAAAVVPAALELESEPDTAVQLHFGGDQPLFEAFRAACLAQFPNDVSHADTALARQDAAALQHLGHTLKTVLTMLGHPELAREAATLDAAAEAADWPRIASSWALLRRGLQVP
jgi:DNA-binding response OmpR family regulator